MILRTVDDVIEAHKQEIDSANNWSKENSMESQQEND
jgi:hypothetical protein